MHTCTLAILTCIHTLQMNNGNCLNLCKRTSLNFFGFTQYVALRLADVPYFKILLCLIPKRVLKFEIKECVPVDVDSREIIAIFVPWHPLIQNVIHHLVVVSTPL